MGDFPNANIDAQEIRILIADDHAVVLDGIKMLLEEQGDMAVVGTARDGLKAVKKAKILCPDVALLDIAMPELSGLEAVSLIKELVPDTEEVILSMHIKESYV